MEARLTLVGAGPGDPDLITVKGIKALASADVVLYDALVHPDLLDYVPDRAKKIYVGKRAGKHSFKQEEINALIVEHAFGSGHVVRLKGGDPYIFARGREEQDYAESFGIPVQVVPGVSSINMVGMYGLPLTLRGISESFWVVTATSQHGQLTKDVTKVAESSATGVFLMGLSQLNKIAEIYKELGKGHLPAIVVSKGSLPDGKVLGTSIDQLQVLVQQEKVASPAIILVGEALQAHEIFAEKVKVEIRNGR